VNVTIPSFSRLSVICHTRLSLNIVVVVVLCPSARPCLLLPRVPSPPTYRLVASRDPISSFSPATCTCPLCCCHYSCCNRPASTRVVGHLLTVYSCSLAWDCHQILSRPPMWQIFDFPPFLIQCSVFIKRSEVVFITHKRLE